MSKMKTHDRAGSRRDLYQDITDRIVAAIEEGTPPWRRPWDPDKCGGPAMPRNAVSGHRYRGMNVLTLGMSPLAFMSSDPRWAMYKQAAERGWQVRGGERGTLGIFYKKLTIADSRDADAGDDDKVRHIPMLRAFTLFHASQIDGIPAYVPPTVAEAPWRAPEAAEIILANSRAVVRIGGERAFYSPGTDHIQMPPRGAFASAGGWASVQLHELGHWTGAEARLDRDLSGRFGSPDYAREELRAEIAQVMVCAELGITECDFSNNDAYVAHWLQKLRDDRKEIFRAAADAQRIADYLLAFHPAYAASEGAVSETTADASGDLVSLPEAA
jgi:antirestriction protein ArdC